MACRSSASGSCTRKATSTSTSRPKAGRRKATRSWCGPMRPSSRCPGPTASSCVIQVPLGDRAVRVAVWRVRLGRVTLYLLDTDLESNAPWDRALSARLYGGDRETRVQQEIILGIGGVGVLRALGLSPAVYHLNEGHAAFVVLQRIREFLDAGHDFDSALAEVRRTTVFTTHTPVPAGHDAFAVPRRGAAPGWLLGPAWRTPRAVPGTGRVRQRQRGAVQHDGARPAVGRRRQRRQPAAR